MAEAEDKEKLVAEAKSLGVKGVLENMKPETLKKKIAEAKGETQISSANVVNNSNLRKFAKFQKGN